MSTSQTASVRATKGAPSVLPRLGELLHAQWRECRRRLNKCQKRCTRRNVHLSRIKTRRLLATSEFVSMLVPKLSMRKPRRELKTYLKACNRLRDTQVQLAQVKTWPAKLPGAKSFRAWLRKRKKHEEREMRSALWGIKLRSLNQQFADPARTLRRGRVELAGAGTTETLTGVIQASFARVRQLRQREPIATPKTIHRTRVAFKRFRYMVEASAPLLATATAAQRKAMRDHQALMGEIQDLEMMLLALGEFGRHRPIEKVSPLLRSKLERRQHTLIRRYQRTEITLNRFWGNPNRSPRRDSQS